MFSKGVAVATILLQISWTVDSGLEEDILHRNKRQLLFPNSTLLQEAGLYIMAISEKSTSLFNRLNIGVATPTPVKTIFLNWAFQLNFQLPWNRTQIPVDIFGANSGYVGVAKKKREIDYGEENIKLFDIYKHVEEMINGEILPRQPPPYNFELHRYSADTYIKSITDNAQSSEPYPNEAWPLAKLAIDCIAGFKMNKIYQHDKTEDFNDFKRTFI